MATDNDAAGQRAAERIYWQLTSRGDAPRRLALPDGLDPADLVHRDGANGLRTAIDSSRSLADILLDARVTLALCRRSVLDIHAALREAGAIIVALPPSRWLSYIDRVTEVLGVPPGTVHKAVLDADSNTSALRKSTAGPQRSSRSSPPNEHALRTAHTGQVLRRDPPDLNLPR